MSCAFAHDDAAYVLGSLAPAERAAFEAHLAVCASCARSVQELAGLPGLLARVDRALLEPPTDLPDVPEVLPAVLAAVRREQRRSARRTAAIAAAAAAAVVALGTWGVATFTGDDDGPVADSPSASPSAPAGEAMVPIATTPVRANLALEGVLWGTRVQLTCTYPGDATLDQPPTGPRYALFVRTWDGEVQQIATWHALRGRTMELTAATAARTDDIAWVEMRAADGTPVARLGV